MTKVKFDKPINLSDTITVEISKWVDKNGDRLWVPVDQWTNRPSQKINFKLFKRLTKDKK